MENCLIMKKQILFCGYRDWAKKIYSSLDNDIVFCESSDDFIKLNPKDFDIAFFVGWSSMVSSSWTDKIMCICLHPSPLPKYRGGSPIQNQILQGEDKSAVTLFEMNDVVDGGPIIFQKEFSLDGTLVDIFSRIILIGTRLIGRVIKDYKEGEGIKSKKQDNAEATTYKRRTPDMSEIKIKDFQEYTAKQLYNKIRCLQYPYPLPFIKCKDNTILYIKDGEF